MLRIFLFDEGASILNDIDVSVLLVTHNHADFIRQALSSIGAQETDLVVEVVVADDASTDSTLRYIEEWAEQVPFPIRVLPPSDRLGITANYQRGFGACKGKYIAVLEGDDEWISVEKLQRQAMMLNDNPNLALVSTRLLRYEQLTGHSTVFPPTWTTSKPTYYSSAQLAAYNWIGTFSTCMYRADSLRRISPGVFTTIAYDWLINMAVTEFGDAGALPQVMTLYRIHPAGVWSSSSQVSRDTELRALLPEYLDILGDRLAPELRREQRALSKRLNSALETAPSHPVKQVEAEFKLPVNHIPRVETITPPRASLVMAAGSNPVSAFASIQSVLSQTISELEIIVVTEAPSNEMRLMLADLSDPRLRTYNFGWFEGVGACLGLAAQQTRAGIIGVIEPGTILPSTLVERQLKSLEEHPDSGGIVIRDSFVDTESPSKISEGTTRATQLRFIFEHGTSSFFSGLFRRNFYESGGLPDNRFGSLNHLGLLTALLKFSPVSVVEIGEPSELPRDTERLSPTLFELADRLVFNEEFFNDFPKDLQIEAFSDLFVDQFANTLHEIECETALLYLNTQCEMQHFNRLEGLRRLREISKSTASSSVLRTQYGISDIELQGIVSDLALPRREETQLTEISTIELIRVVRRRLRSMTPSSIVKRILRNKD